MADNNYGKVIFDRDTSAAVSEILKKYNLDENTNEGFNKIKNEELFNGEYILMMVEEIILGTAEEKNLASLIETKLKIPKQTAQELAIDVKEKLLLGARKATQEEIIALENESEIETEPVSEYSESIEERQVVPNPFVAPPIKPVEPIVPDRSEARVAKNQPPIEKKRDDAYREPIN